MTERDDDIVGHKTLRNEAGELYHEPLTRKEAEGFRAAADAAKAKRAALYPDAEAAVHGLWDAWYRLKELGWKDPRYAPADERLKKVVEIGSSGIHDALCKPRDGPKGEGDKWWWIPEGGYCPSSPILYLPDERERADEERRGAELRARFEAFRKQSSGSTE